MTTKGGHQTLTEREIATILAALLFWREEMCPHDPAIMQPYFETVGMPSIEPLSADEIVVLSERLRSQWPS
jgi:hypothetical protein